MMLRNLSLASQALVDAHITMEYSGFQAASHLFEDLIDGKVQSTVHVLHARRRH